MPASSRPNCNRSSGPLRSVGPCVTALGTIKHSLGHIVLTPACVGPDNPAHQVPSQVPVQRGIAMNRYIVRRAAAALALICVSALTGLAVAAISEIPVTTNSESARMATRARRHARERSPTSRPTRSLPSSQPKSPRADSISRNCRRSSTTNSRTCLRIMCTVSVARRALVPPGVRCHWFHRMKHRCCGTSRGC